MPSLEYLTRWQKAVYWHKYADDEAGQPQVMGPRELDVRWEEKRGESVNAQGEVIAIDATITVDREIALGSLFWKGRLVDLNPEATDLELMQAVTYSEIPDDKARNVEYVMGAQRFRGTLPHVGTGTSP